MNARPDQLPAWLGHLITATGLYTLAVILWGAVVRITGSGAGCGQHWPTCHGDIVPLAPSIETLIEFGHRTTSGLCLVAVLGTAVAAWVIAPPPHPIRRAALVSAVFIITEALIGAAIVLLEYVAHNASYYRAAWMALHLVNTFILTGGLGAMAWFFRSSVGFRLIDLQGFRVPFLALIAGVVLVSTSGAVSALGQTLFPALAEQSILEHVTEDPYADTPYPMLLRLVHPVVAVFVSAGLLAFARAARERMSVQSVARWSDVLTGMVVVQLVVGVVNVGLSAPGWMQLVHLAAANALWLSLLGTAAAIATETVTRRRP